MFQRTSFLLALVLTVALATGCAPARVADPPSAPTDAPNQAAAAKRPATAEEIFLYAGPDRQAILEEGARKEGKLLWYSSGVARFNRPLAEAFMRKYPFIKVDLVRLEGLEMVTRVVEEYRANKHDVDAVEATFSAISGLKDAKVLAKFSSPVLEGLPKEAIDRDGYFFPDRENPRVLQYNTNIVPESEAPKTYDDLLNPKWKGKMATHGSSQAIDFLGAMVHLKGEDYVRKLAQQDITVYVTGSDGSMAELVAAGEVPIMFPGAVGTAIDLKKQGAPIGWSPLDQAPTVLGYVALPVRAPHPHSAALFADFLLSDAGQEVRVETEMGAVRKGVRNPYPEFKKLYTDFLVPESEYQAQFKRLSDLHNQLFVKRLQ